MGMAWHLFEGGGCWRIKGVPRRRSRSNGWGRVTKLMSCELLNEAGTHSPNDTGRFYDSPPLPSSSCTEGRHSLQQTLCNERLLFLTVLIVVIYRVGGGFEKNIMVALARVYQEVPFVTSCSCPSSEEGWHYYVQKVIDVLGETCPEGDLETQMSFSTMDPCGLRMVTRIPGQTSWGFHWEPWMEDSG